MRNRMGIAWCLAGVGAWFGAAGCMASDVPRALEYFPISADGYWIYDGTQDGRAVRGAIQCVGTDAQGAPRLQMAWEQGAPLRFRAQRHDGFLELRTDDGAVLRLLPDVPAETPTWEWDNHGVPYRGRVVHSDGFLVVPAGRFADVLEVEIGPATGNAERWRWSFVVGVGPIKQRAVSPGQPGPPTLELSRYESGVAIPVPDAAGPDAGAPTPPPATSGAAGPGKPAPSHG